MTKASLAILTLIFLCPGALFSHAAPVGDFDTEGSVGSPTLPGSSRFNDADQTYSVTGAGTNMWFGADQCEFISKKLNGDFLLRARAEFLGKGKDPHRKMGWMARASLDPDAPYADAAEHGSGLTSLQFRPVRGANTLEMQLPITNADVLQFERRGNRFIFSAAHYGEPFVSVETNLDLDTTLDAGLFVCSHAGDTTETAVFRDVRIVRPASPDFRPYHDYLGSVLEILDVGTGKLERVYSSTNPFEAPNWTRDGRALIFNFSGRGENRGRLARFDLAAKTPILINTDFATNNNNDHVISFDGAMLGISGQGADHGQSEVLTLPVAGGKPRQITATGPSYLHGWSPDEKWLAFTGRRNGKFDIYKIPSDGSGSEIRLTTADGLNDGPEYSPDGNYIYFNSSRTGRMQLWRMKTDGSDQEELTDDVFNNWFPHISPDGKWIAFLSFGLDVSPTDHPYYKHVYLRLLRVGEHQPKVIAYVYGGQGTMNVPSWSPDSRRLAFVSNTGF